MPNEPMVSIKFNVAQIQRVQRMCAGIRNGFARVAQGAVSKTLSRIKTLVVRRLSRAANVGQKSLRREIYVKRPTFKVLAGFVSFRGGRIPIAEMSPTQTKKGVSFRGAEGRRTIPGAFIATMKSGHRGVWKRFAGQKTGVGPGSGTRRNLARQRERIAELHGPSFWWAWESHPEVEREVHGEAQGILGVELERRLEYVLMKHGGR